MATKSFSASVNKFVMKSQIAVEAVFKQSVQDVLSEANKPTAQGGRMRVDTGFLRNSLSVNLNAPAMGPSNPRTESQGNADDAVLKINEANVGDIIWAGWSANYAGVREYKDGFLAAPVQRWNAIVRANAAAMKRAMK